MDQLIKSAYSYIFDSKLPVWSIEIDRCVDQIGNNFNNNHFYVKALNNYIERGYDSSILLSQLRSYYSNFQPKNQKEVFKLDSSYNSKLFQLSSKDYIMLPWEFHLGDELL